MQQTISAHIQQRVTRIEQIDLTLDVDVTDIITLTDAAELLNRDISAISRQVGVELPQVIISPTKRRYTLKSAVMKLKEDIEKVRSSALPLLSSELPDDPTTKNEISD